MIMKLNKYIFAVCALALTACQSGDGVDELLDKPATDSAEPVEVSFAISTRAVNEGVTNPTATEYELMHSYRIIIADENGKIVESIDHQLGANEPAVVQDKAYILIAPGKYKAYGFANIDGHILDEKGLKVDGSTSGIKDLTYSIPQVQGRTGLLAAKDLDFYIPMSSEHSGLAMDVKGTGKENFVIEVRRMMAKVEFSFVNNTDQKLGLLKQEIGNMTTFGSTVYLMNQLEGRNVLNFPTQLSFAKYSYAYGNGDVVIPAGAEGYNKGFQGNPNTTFYVLESKADETSESFQLGFDLRNYVDDAPAQTETMRYALTDPTRFTLIHRNDWIRIPITISDWDMRITTRFYPPIGGYPEAVIEKNPDQNFTVSFSSGGDFVIIPEMRKLYSNSDWFGLEDHEKISGAPVVTVEVPDDKVFTTKGQVKYKNGEIIGCINGANGAEGTATVTIKVNVITTPATGSTPAVTRTITRKIFIVRK